MSNFIARDPLGGPITEPVRREREHFATLCRIALLLGRWRTWAEQNDQPDVLAFTDELADELGVEFGGETDE